MELYARTPYRYKYIFSSHILYKKNHCKRLACDGGQRPTALLSLFLQIYMSFMLKNKKYVFSWYILICMRIREPINADLTHYLRMRMSVFLCT